MARRWRFLLAALLVAESIGLATWQEHTVAGEFDEYPRTSTPLPVESVLLPNHPAARPSANHLLKTVPIVVTQRLAPTRTLSLGVTSTSSEIPLASETHSPSVTHVLMDVAFPINAPVPEHDTFPMGLAASVDIPHPIASGPYAGQLAPYRERLHADGDAASMVAIDRSIMDESAITPMWWESLIAQPILAVSQTQAIDAASLAEVSLLSSPYVQGLLTEPKIKCNDVVIADAAFDSMSFIDARFTGTNDPIGSILTTGDDSTRFRDDLFASSIGVRKLNRGGSNVELSQRGGFQSNNSTFLIPNSQGTSRLELSFSQPLMRDRGKAVNMTRVVLASIDVQLARSEVREKVEDHLVDVTRAYWDLYQTRAEFIQRLRLVQEAEKLHAMLLARSELDSQKRQVLRAEVALTRRRSELIRIRTRIANAQSRLRLLTGNASLLAASNWELLPQDQPLNASVELSTRQAALTALDNRPDIAQSLRAIQAVSARVGAARNQVLPRLDLILSGYVAGLDDDSNTFGAIGNQFTDGGPGFAAGMVFERPIGNRAGEARYQRSRWELTRSVFEFQQTTETAITEVEIAVRETKAAYAELVARTQSVHAAAAEVDYLYQRWKWLPDPNESAILLIEDLLDSQERTADEERSVAIAQTAYAMSWINVRKAMGVLMQVHCDIGGDRP